jgi:hypothetical protein
MSLNFQQVREQIHRLGELAPLRYKKIREKQTQARELLEAGTIDLEHLHAKVTNLARNHDPNLRCALPLRAANGDFISLDVQHPLPALPEQATMIAADGSQITPDRHSEAYFGLINVGAIKMRLGSPNPPETVTESELLYNDELFDLTEAFLALKRDLAERNMLAELAEKAAAPVITFTDGPMELWGAKETQSSSEFKRSLDSYIDVLKNLENLAVITAGYVDKPAATLVVRLLEIALLPENNYSEVKNHHPLRGVMDIDLYRDLLKPSERSAVFNIQSRSAQYYRNGLALHFFYLNVGREGDPWPVRVEIPGWVAGNSHMLDDLHAALVGQCRIMGGRAYPYLLHRAHEAAVVSFEEKAQVSQMIGFELRKRNLQTASVSYKQATKELSGRTSYHRSRKR